MSESRFLRNPEALAELLLAKRDRDCEVQDRLYSLRERVRLTLTPESSEETRAVYEELNAVLYIVRGDTFGLEARMSLDAMWDMQRRLEKVQEAAAPFDRSGYSSRSGPGQGEGKSLGGGTAAR